MSERLTLDHSSFEKLLAAAWVLQCLHDQLHHPAVSREETIVELAGTPEPRQSGHSDLPPAAQSGVQPSPGVTCAESILDAVNDPPADDKTLAPLVAQPAETSAPVLNTPFTVEPKTVDPGTSLHSENAATLYTSKLVLPVFPKVANDDKNDRPRPSSFNVARANLRDALRRALDAFTHLRPAFRVSLPVRAVRSVAIATPVLVLALVAASLLLETWHRDPFNNAQVSSRPGAPAAEEVDAPKTPTTTKRAASDGHKRITNKTPGRPSATPPPRSSHREVTDAATLSAVQGLSKYELRGLRRRAKYGDASAAFTLGMAYEVGRHVPQNCAEATRWVTTSAEAGDAAAEYNLGLRYRDGDGVTANRAESAKWLRRAAARKYSKANLALKMLASH